MIISTPEIEHTIGIHVYNTLILCSPLPPPPPQKKKIKKLNVIGQPCISIGRFHKREGEWNCPLPFLPPFWLKWAKIWLYTTILGHLEPFCAMLHPATILAIFKFGQLLGWNGANYDLIWLLEDIWNHLSKVWPGFTVNDFQLLVSFLSKNWTKYDHMTIRNHLEPC